MRTTLLTLSLIAAGLPLTWAAGSGSTHSSLLSELNVGGKNILKPGLFDYYTTFDPLDLNVSTTTYKRQDDDATITLPNDDAPGPQTWKVSNTTGASTDPDGLSEHTYTLTTVYTPNFERGYLNVWSMSNGVEQQRITTNEESPLYLIPESGQTRVVLAAVDFPGYDWLSAANIELTVTKASADGADTYKSAGDVQIRQADGLTTSGSVDGKKEDGVVDFTFIITFTTATSSAQFKATLTTNKVKETGLTLPSAWEASRPAECYDLQGRRVPATHNGLVIERRGGRGALRLNK